MSTAILSTGIPVLADALLRPRTGTIRLATNMAVVLTGTALVAVASQIAIPFLPVPLTMQTFAVLLVGTVLWPARGVISLSLYLVLGVVGLPIFAAGKSGNRLALTTGGYIVGFIAAAALIGFLARLKWDRRFVRMLVSFGAGSLVIYAFGLTLLYFSLGSLGSLGEAVWGGKMGYSNLLLATLGAGLLPFLVGDAVKALVAALLVPRTWRGVRWLDARSSGR